MRKIVTISLLSIAILLWTMYHFGFIANKVINANAASFVATTAIMNDSDFSSALNSTISVQVAMNERK